MDEHSFVKNYLKPSDVNLNADIVHPLPPIDGLKKSGEFIVQGKPTNAWEPYIPVTFELGVLLTAFTCLGGMLMLNGLPRWNHPLFRSERFLKVSDDRLMIAVEAADANFDPDATRRLLEESGGTNIEFIEDDD